MWPLIAAVAATALKAGGQIVAGNTADQAASYEATQLDQQAGLSVATSQRLAAEERRKAQLIASRIQALAGGGGLDESVARTTADVYGEGEYRALTAMFEGDERARGLHARAEARRYEGKMAKWSGRMGAISSVLSGASGMNFGGGGAAGFSGGNMSENFTQANAKGAY